MIGCLTIEILSISLFQDMMIKIKVKSRMINWIDVFILLLATQLCGWQFSTALSTMKSITFEYNHKMPAIRPAIPANLLEKVKNKICGE